MRGLAHLKRSTAPSKAWMPNARLQCRCPAPQPRSGAPLSAGIDNGAVAAAQSPMPSIAARRRTDRSQPFQRRRCLHGASASVPNLHQLDGRDPAAATGLDFSDHQLLDELVPDPLAISAAFCSRCHRPILIGAGFMANSILALVSACAVAM
jgi:hypothetical protein